jgi:DNA-directed RNA polymerase sigma subunit (sigma70/sigma32)
MYWPTSPRHAGRCSRNLGREPTPGELAAELDMTPEKVIEVQKYGR